MDSKNFDAEKYTTSEYFESGIIKEKSIIFNSLYELKSIANVDELTISHKTLQNEVNYYLSNKFNRLTQKSLRASSASKSSLIFKLCIVSYVQFLFRFHVVVTFRTTFREHNSRRFTRSQQLPRKQRNTRNHSRATHRLDLPLLIVSESKFYRHLEDEKFF